MRANRRRDTSPELAVRRLLHAAGLRFRVDLPLRDGGGRAVRPDIVFTRRRIAIFIDGCFWHGCPEHGRKPGGANEGYWGAKIARNRERDAEHVARLTTAGWHVMRFWEHDDPAVVAQDILRAVGTQGSKSRTRTAAMQR